MISEINEARKTIDRDLLRQAEHLLTQHTGDASTFPKIVDSVKQGKAIIRVPFCEGTSCKDSIEANTSMEIIGFALESSSFHRCIACSSNARKLAYLAKTY